MISLMQMQFQSFWERVRASTPEKHTLQNTQENGVSSFWLKKWGTVT